MKKNKTVLFLCLFLICVIVIDMITGKALFETFRGAAPSQHMSTIIPRRATLTQSQSQWAYVDTDGDQPLFYGLLPKVI